MVGIYKITNLINKKVYIGQSTDIEHRFNDYKRLRCKGQTKLYASLKKHGIENHKFEIITECDLEQLNNLERYYQDLYNVSDRKCGLNLKLTKSTDRSGKHSEESIQKMSEKAKNRSDETRKKMSEAHKGRKHSEDSKIKMSKSQKGKIVSSETRLKISEAHKKLNQSGYVNPLAKMVIDLETGFIYNSAKEAWDHNRDYIKTTYGVFTYNLQGFVKRGTKFQYI